MVLDKTSKLPIYYQLKEIIKEKIQEGEYSEGELLPSERELCVQYDISRMTVRQAINELQVEGYLYKVHGKGSFVRSNKIEQNLASLTSFSEDMRRMGRKPGSKILSVETQKANAEIAQKLGLHIGDNVLLLRRLRFADQQPICIEKTYLNANLIEQFDIFQTQDFSLYEYLQTTLHIKLARAHQTIETILLSGKEANLLAVMENSLGLLMERITYNEKNEAIEYVRSTYRGDTYKFVIELKATNGNESL